MKSTTVTTKRPASALIAGLEASLGAAERKTLMHLIKESIGENSLRALRSDMAYIEAWHTAFYREKLNWPPALEVALSFVAHHLWDPDQQAIDPEHGMPADVEEDLRQFGYLKAPGPHSVATVQRRLASWRSMCKWRGLDHPFSAPEFRRALGAAIRANNRPKARKSKHVVTLELVTALLDHLDIEAEIEVFDDRGLKARKMRAIRDRAMIAVMFASGGRRRSEIATLRHGAIVDLPAIAVQSEEWPDGLPSAGLRLGRTKTTNAVDDAAVFMTGRAVVALNAWRNVSGVHAGPVFRRIDRWGELHAIELTPASINAIVKQRLKEIGQDPAQFSAHGVRAGYITSAFKAGIPAPEIMEQTLHKSLPVLLGYFKDEDQRMGKAARIL